MLVAALRARGIAEIDTGTRRRAEYTTDASNYRVVPDAVVYPRDADEIAAVIDAARETGGSVTARGGGTSIAGNAVGPGVVLDLSRHLTRVESVDPDARTAVVQPGVVLADLQRRAAPHGLRFGPDPSSANRATIGGMIGNNACGHRALTYGRTADNVIALDVIDGSGRRLAAGTGAGQAPGLDALVDTHLGIIRTELGRFSRQISGYSLEHLLPEHGRDLAKALVGTEGTVAVATRATLRLVEVAHQPLLVVLGFPDMPAAADAVPALLQHRPLAIEGLDERLVDAVRRRHGRVPALPDGGGWLLVEVTGDDAAAALDLANRVAADAGTSAVRILTAGPEASAVWRIREDGAGLAGRTERNRQAWPGLEDVAVPPEHLGAYLRDLSRLMVEHDLEGAPYGHFGDGCVHLRLDIPLDTDGAALRALMVDAAGVIAGYGGSLSGEHGDGRARGELLPVMYSPAMIELFGRFKALFDPDRVLNPGVGVAPAALDADLRRPAAASAPATSGFAFLHDRGDFTMAVHRCVGVGKCRADTTAAGGFMCPSYLATKDEKDSTRGRARVLQEMLNGGLVQDSWDAPEVAESLDLCLSCKACSSDCPAGVDMAAYKSEVLHRRYERRIRPVTHYTLGWLPRWARLGTRFGSIVNLLLSARPLERFALFAGGMDTRRRIPRFATTPFRTTWRRRARAAPRAAKVVLWGDTFSDNFSPEILAATLELLEAAGYEVLMPPDVCCGLTWITTGQLDTARRKLADLVDALHPFAAQGIPILGVEPSCTAVLRSDLLELLPGDERATGVSQSVVTLAELLATAPRDWSRPDLTGVDVLVQPHCHQHSVMGFQRDRALLESLGATVTELAGCCGLAGNFGLERGHYDVSVLVAENALLPALRLKADETVFLADGLSCRTQADQLGGVAGIHLAELLQRHAPGRVGPVA